MVNSDLIKFIERSPDTVLTLVTGEKLIVRETPDDVLHKVVAFRQSILNGVTGDPRWTAAGTGRIPSPDDEERTR